MLTFLSFFNDKMLLNGMRKTANTQSRCNSFLSYEQTLHKITYAA